MSYLLNGTEIRRPSSISVGNSTQYAQHRTLDGTISRDYMGNNKRTWILEYENVNVTDFNTINTLYSTYLSNTTPQTWEITETNYTVSSTNVHLNLDERSFGVKGESYISDFRLTLVEN